MCTYVLVGRFEMLIEQLIDFCLWQKKQGEFTSNNKEYTFEFQGEKSLKVQFLFEHLNLSLENSFVACLRRGMSFPFKLDSLLNYAQYLWNGT